MGVDASWLVARTAADDAARAVTTSTLLPTLVRQLTQRRQSQQSTDVRLIDVGAGSGANQRWLAPRLPFAQRWVHLDRDSAILEHTHDVGPTEFVIGGIDALTGLLDGTDEPTVITCAAVLDVLTRSDLGLLCDLIITRRVPALLSLSVTGEMTIEPGRRWDADLLSAFNRHQRRDGLAGPDAPALVVARCHAAGVRILSRDTPWLLGAASDPGFVARFLRERVEAAVCQAPELEEPAADWLRHRLAEHTAGACRIVVGHRDLLILP